MQGNVERYSANGMLLRRTCVSHSPIRCSLAVGATLWFGLEDGSLVALDTASHTKLASFPAHADAVVSLCQAGNFLYSLARSGTIAAHSARLPRACAQGCDENAERAWHSAWCDALDAWERKLGDSVAPVRVGLRVCTWNVNDSRPRAGSVHRLVCGDPCAL